MDNQVFQKIFDLLQDSLTEKWDKIIFRAIYLEGSYNMKYYAKENGKYIDCYSIKGLGEMQVEDIFMDIDTNLREERQTLADNWSVMTMVIDRQGKFQTQYEYSDISENMIDFIDEWEKRFLV